MFLSCNELITVDNNMKPAVVWYHQHCVCHENTVQPMFVDY